MEKRDLSRVGGLRMSRPTRAVRLGRPPGADREERQAAIEQAAIRHFATSGFSATTLSAIARDAGLTLAALYHYFTNKAELYEAVYAKTSEKNWQSALRGVDTAPTLSDAIDRMVANRRDRPAELAYWSDFIAMVPTEARLHPEFRHLLDVRTKLQDEVFGRLGELGIATGELGGLTLEEATEFLRIAIMGWTLERHYRQAELTEAATALKKIFTRLSIGGST